MIKSSELISELFSEIPAENKLSRDFLFVRFLTNRNHQGTKFGLVVGKRFFKKAVDRNLIKRRIREALRLNQGLLEEPEGVAVLIIYRSKNIKTFVEIDKAMKKLLVSLNSQLESNT
jgi:ribonuclease P protein component